MTSKDNELPTTWTWITFKDAVDSISTNNKKIKQKDYLAFGKFPIVDQGQSLIGGYTNDDSKVIFSQRPLIIFGDHTRTLKFISQNFAPGAEGVKILAPQKFFELKLFLYFTQHLVSNLVDNGYARHYQHLEKCSIPLPPIKEQKLIVAKIEELFSELDKGLENLQKAQDFLKIYRQTLLKSAFEGKLTEKWREENKIFESADELYKRLRDIPQPSIQKQKNSFLSHTETSHLSKLPKTWYWTCLGCSGDWIGGGTPSKLIETFWLDGHILWVSPKDMKSRYITDTLQKISSEGVKNSSAKLIHEKSLLFVVRSGILRRILPIAIAPEYITINQDLQACCPKFHNVEFLYWYCVFQEHKIREQCSKDGTTVESIDSAALKRFPVPVTCLEEQNEIVNILEDKLYTIEKIEEDIKLKTLQLDQLRQSILKKAFSGELVAQNPTDEPASMLFERIKAEQTIQNNQKEPPKKQKVAT